ncbi:hypothetical protein [Bradyrhizobium monzae]|uniref:hypothetical protein n=1 Tax=Bradyrhizobium sp. Oc8 TaxID=2876780 RepID=UPI003208A4CF
MTIDELLEALCALDGGPRQLHAGVAITGPGLAALFHDRSKLPPDPRQQDAAVTSIGIAQDNDRPTSPAP